MDKIVKQRTEEIKKLHGRKRLRHRFLSVLSVIVVFATTYLLVLPAITMETPPACGMEEHAHTDECYEERSYLSCGMEETPSHTHSEDCYDEEGLLICGTEETAGHVHDASCYSTERVLVCGIEEHVHTQLCYPADDNAETDTPAEPETEEDPAEEQEEEIREQGDPTADLESRSYWESTFSNVTLSGDWGTDVLAIAKTQLGYTESSLNYIYDENGTRKGYTRYGAWYGSSYGDWCAMFVSFCLNYAGVDRELMPFEAGCERWVNKLIEKNLYRDNTYDPRPGDLIFFDWDEDPDADHVGLVYEVIRSEDESIIEIKTIEGNNGNRVAYHTYSYTDRGILGYGVLPENPNAPVETEDSHEAETKEEPIPASQEPVLLRAQIENNVIITMTGPADAFEVPVEELELSVSLVEDPVAKELIEAEAATRNLENTRRKTLIFDIRIMQGETEVQPVKPVSVTFTGIEAPKDDAQVFHVDTESKTAEVMETTTGEGGDISVETDHFSLYGVTFTVDFHYDQDEIYLSTVANDGITVTLRAPVDAFTVPAEELTLAVVPIHEESAKKMVEDEAEQSTAATEDLKDSIESKATDVSNQSAQRKTLLFDIKIMHGDEEVQPLKTVLLTFSGINASKNDGQIFHVDEEKGTVENMNASTDANGDIFVETDHFSLYGITFTVDFHYGEYTFSMNGKDVVYLSEIFEALHIENEITDIKNVEFSDPSLLLVEPWTLNGSPDFLLTSLVSFDSEETLTVLFEDESKIIIRVTDPIFGPNTSNKVVATGSTSNFMTDFPFTAVSIDPTKCRMSLAEFSTSNGSAFHFGSTMGAVGAPVTAPYFLGAIAPNSTTDVVGSYSLVFRDAAILSNGQKANVQINVSGIRILNRSSSVSLNKILFATYDGCQIGCWGFVDESTLGPLASAAMQADVNIKVTYPDGSVIGVGQPMLWSCRDIDAAYAAPYFESYTVLSGALSKAYVPTTNFLNITNETANYSDTANGLKFTATQYDSETYDSGFAMITEAAGVDLRWRGCNCGTSLFEKDLSISIRPQYKAYGESGLSNWNTGDTGGTISMTDVSNSSILAWQTSGSTSAGYLMRFCGYGKNIPMTVGAKEGYVLSDLTVNGTSVVDDITNNSYAISNMQTNHSVDVFYLPITGSITITKTDEQTGELLTGAVFTVSGTSSIHGEFTLTSTDNGDGTYSISNIPYGKNTDIYTISETTAPTNYEAAPDQVVTGDQFAQNGSNIPLSFKDKLSVHTLTVSKTVIGGGTGSFPFKVTLKNADDETVIIPADTANPATYTVDPSTGEITFSLKHGESVTLKAVPVGTVATVTETEHDGYTVLIKNTTAGGTVLSNSDTASVTVTKDQAVEVVNNAGVMLPSTGGSGVPLYLLCGIALCVAALAVGYKLRRERERRQT